MPNTTNLQLPLLEQAQAQKHVVVNDTLTQLDALVLLAVISHTTTAPPTAPADGARYIVPANATGAWAGYANSVAAFYNGAWAFFTPRTGWHTHVADEQRLILFNGTAWQNSLGNAVFDSLTLTITPNAGSALPAAAPSAWLPITVGTATYKIPLWL